MTCASHRFTEARDDFARRPGDETHPLARNHGPDWRRVLQIEDKPFAEQNEGNFWAYFGDLHGDPAPDLTAHARSTWGLS